MTEPGSASEASAEVGTELQLGPLERPVRLSRPRLKSFEYVGQHAYHVVMVTNRRVPVFEDWSFAQACIAFLEETAVATDFDLLAYCLMPDHLHLSAQGRTDKAQFIGFIQRFKQRSGYHFKCESSDRLWQPSYFERILRRDEDLQATANYVLLNPVTNGLVTAAGDYRFSGGLCWTGVLPDRAEAPSLHRDS